MKDDAVEIWPFRGEGVRKSTKTDATGEEKDGVPILLFERDLFIPGENGEVAEIERVLFPDRTFSIEEYNQKQITKSTNQNGTGQQNVLRAKFVWTFSFALAILPIDYTNPMATS